MPAFRRVVEGRIVACVDSNIVWERVQTLELLQFDLNLAEQGMTFGRSILILLHSTFRHILQSQCPRETHCTVWSYAFQEFDLLGLVLAQDLNFPRTIAIQLSEAQVFIYGHNIIEKSDCSDMLSHRIERDLVVKSKCWSWCFIYAFPLVDMHKLLPQSHEQDPLNSFNTPESMTLFPRSSPSPASL